MWALKNGLVIWKNHIIQMQKHKRWRNLREKLLVLKACWVSWYTSWTRFNYIIWAQRTNYNEPLDHTEF